MKISSQDKQFLMNSFFAGVILFVGEILGFFYIYKIADPTLQCMNNFFCLGDAVLILLFQAVYVLISLIFLLYKMVKQKVPRSWLIILFGTCTVLFLFGFPTFLYLAPISYPLIFVVYYVLFAKILSSDKPTTKVRIKKRK